MSNYPVVLGIDPGFANFGIAAIRLLSTTEEILHVEVIQTKPSPKKRRIMAVDDNNRRGLEISHKLLYMLGAYEPFVIIAEEMSYPPNAATAGKMMMAWGILVALSISRPLSIPIRAVGTQELKLATAGDRKATKAQVAGAVIRRYPDSKELARFVGCTPKTKQEHGIDAIGAVIAALNSDIIGALRPR